MKRPLMWYCLLGIFLLYCITNAVATLHPPENLSGEVILCGRIVKKEVKNGRMLLYLKGASICSVSADYSKKTDSGEKTKENSLKEFTNKSTNTTEYEDGKAPFGDDLKRLRNRGVVCYVPDYRDGMDFEDAYVIGKKVYLAGGISLMNEATNPGEFDAAKYYRARGYYYTLYNAEIVKTNFGVTGKDANIGEGNRSTVGNAKVVGVSNRSAGASLQAAQKMQQQTLRISRRRVRRNRIGYAFRRKRESFRGYERTLSGRRDFPYSCHQRSSYFHNRRIPVCDTYLFPASEKSFFYFNGRHSYFVRNHGRICTVRIPCRIHVCVQTACQEFKEGIRSADSTCTECFLHMSVLSFHGDGQLFFINVSCVFRNRLCISQSGKCKERKYR